MMLFFHLGAARPLSSLADLQMQFIGWWEIKLEERHIYITLTTSFFLAQQAPQNAVSSWPRCGTLEVPLSDEKEDGPAPQLTFLGVLLDSIRQTISLHLEMILILLALMAWGQKLRRKRIIFHCDNEGATFAWENLGSSNDGVLDLMRRMTTEAARGNFALTIKHVRGVDSGIADALSRFQEPRFRKLAPTAQRNPVPLPSGF